MFKYGYDWHDNNKRYVTFDYYPSILFANIENNRITFASIDTEYYVSNIINGTYDKCNSILYDMDTIIKYESILKSKNNSLADYSPKNNKRTLD